MDNFPFNSETKIERIKILVSYNANDKQFTLESFILCEKFSLEVPLIFLKLSELEYFDENDFFNTVIDYCVDELYDNCTCKADEDICSEIEDKLTHAEWDSEYIDFDIVDKTVIPYIPFHASVNVSIMNSTNFKVDVELTIENMRDEIFSFENKSLSLAFDDDDDSLCLIDKDNTQLLYESEFYDNLISQIKSHIIIFLGYNQNLCDALIGNLEKNIDIIYKDFMLVERENGLLVAFRFFEKSKNQLFKEKKIEHSEYQIILNITEGEKGLEINVYIPRCSYKPTYILDTTFIKLESSKAYANSIINFVKFKLSNDNYFAKKVIECNEINAKSGISALPDFDEFFWLQNANNISWIFISKNFMFPHYVDENILFKDYSLPIDDLTQKFTDEFLQLRETLKLTKETFISSTGYSNTLLSELKKGSKGTSIQKLCVAFEGLSNDSDWVESPDNKKGVKKS